MSEIDTDSMTGAANVDEPNTPLQALTSKHARERKEAQAKIASLKHSVTKNDKKRKKEVGQEVEAIEREMKERHSAELAQINAKMTSVELEDNGSAPIAAASCDVAEDAPKKPSKAQLRREKKADEVKRRQAAVLDDMRNAEHSASRVEMKQLEEQLARRGFAPHEIASDGDCLYNAVAHQLADRGMDGDELRLMAAALIRENLPEYLPFLTSSDGEPLEENGVDDYLQGVEKSCRHGGAWGGEAEVLHNLAASEIVQASGQAVEYTPHGKESTGSRESVAKPPLTVTYHRFYCMLGEHYNSTVPLAPGSD